MIESFLTEIRRRLRSRIAAEADYMAAGKPQTWEEYQRRVGAVQGLNRALNDIAEVVKKYADIGEVDEDET